MYVEKLAIRNFRNFRETEFELNHPGRAAADGRPGPARLENVNLFLGGNGAGKSSVFKALALGVLAPVIRSSGFQAEYLVRRPAGDAPEGGDKAARPVMESAEIRAHLTLDALDQSEQGERVVGQTVIERIGDFEDIVSAGYGDSGAGKSIFYDDSPALFLAGYGANRRTERPEGYSENSRRLRYQRVASLFEEHVGLVPFSFAYLQVREFGHLEAARDVLNALLPDEVSLTDRTDSQNRPLFDRDGVFLPFNALSDGFRTFAGWVWDLLFQLARLQGPNGPRRALTETPGVVIVDEIDLFLHPEWQRLVIEQIAGAFPALQFLFSSHSPLVAGTLEPGNIFVLDNERVEQYQEDIYGLTPNQVLTSSYFGLRSTRAPKTGTLSTLAKRALGQTAVVVPEEAEPKDRALAPDEKADRMLQEIDDDDSLPERAVTA